MGAFEYILPILLVSVSNFAWAIDNLDFATYSVTCDVDLEKAMNLKCRTELQCKALCIRNKCLAFYFDEDLYLCYLFDQQRLQHIEPYAKMKNAPTIKVLNLGTGNEGMRCPCGYAGVYQHCYRPTMSNATSEEARTTCMYGGAAGRIHRLHSEADLQAFTLLANYISTPSYEIQCIAVPIGEVLWDVDELFPDGEGFLINVAASSRGGQCSSQADLVYPTTGQPDVTSTDSTGSPDVTTTGSVETTEPEDVTGCQRAIDGRLTSRNEWVVTTGAEVSITVTFRRSYTVNRIRLMQRYDHNNIIQNAMIKFSDGSNHSVNFTDRETDELQWIDITNMTARLTTNITISSSYNTNQGGFAEIEVYCVETKDNVAWRQNGASAVCNTALSWEYPCENAIDGHYDLPVAGNPYEFVVDGGGVDSWIQLTFDACYVLVEVRILQRVYYVDLAQLIHITFDDESVQLFTLHTRNYDALEWDEFMLTPILSSSARLTVKSMAVVANWGLAEIEFLASAGYRYTLPYPWSGTQVRSSKQLSCIHTATVICEADPE